MTASYEASSDSSDASAKVEDDVVGPLFGARGALWDAFGSALEGMFEGTLGSVFEGGRVFEGPLGGALGGTLGAVGAPESVTERGEIGTRVLVIAVEEAVVAGRVDEAKGVERVILGRWRELLDEEGVAREAAEVEELAMVLESEGMVGEPERVEGTVLDMAVEVLETDVDVERKTGAEEFSTIEGP